jgi:hypothetical protein
MHEGMRRPVVLAFVVFVGMPGCTCGSKSAAPSAGVDAEAPAAASAAPSALPAGAGVRFSRPIAAARAGGGAVLVAGLVVPEKAIVVTRIEPSGASTFTTRALRNVGWTADAELRAYPADGGVAVVWRGLRDGKMVRQLAVVAKDGALVGEPVNVGPSTCATDDGVSWAEPGAGGKSRVVVRAWAGASRDVAAVGADREPVIVCAAHRVFALGQGDDDVVFSHSDGGPARTLVGHDDFGLDEERELEEVTIGDELALFRVGSTGAIAVRETKDGAPLPWRKLTATIPGDDDLVAVDADANAFVAVTTRDAPEACSGEAGARAGTGTSVHALRIGRAGGESTALLAAGECGKDLGPFWIGAAGAALVVAWAEHVPKTAPSAPPIAGLAYRTFAGPTPGALGRVPLAADALVDAGCDEKKCYAVALAQEAAKVLAFP